MAARIVVGRARKDTPRHAPSSAGRRLPAHSIRKSVSARNYSAWARRYTLPKTETQNSSDPKAVNAAIQYAAVPRAP